MRDLSWQTISQYSTDIGCQPAGPAQAAIQAVLNDLEALKASKDLEAICHGHKFGGVNPISIDRPSFAFRCFRLRWVLVEQTWQLGSNPNWSAIVISSTSIPLVLSMRVKYAASHPGRAFVSARPVASLMNSHRNSEGNPKGPVRIQ